ncbi:uncharacterized protein LOC131290491 [Anopheles ziemanni]|uniref:uncharacterized protein LOC131290491 n=1 Tax=Anopheles ziemanni TaxID=345580 RepID=UPI00265FC2B0|nr:uncharacterized protein LOC131290491 [Anopheles ziemanni]
MQLNSSTNAAHGEKAICLRRPSPTVAQLEDHREESINFYGGLVQRSHREANFSPQESSLAGTPCELPLHDDTSCLAPRRLDTAPSGKEGAGVGVCSPFLSLAAVEDDTSWMNTTTTMVDSSSCTPSTPIDWWKVDGSMFMDEGGTHHMAELKAALATAQGSCNSSSDSTGERFPLNARKTASADVCRLELDKSPRRRSFGGAETSVTVHGVCNKTINGGSGGGGGGGSGNSGNSGKFSNAEPIGSAMTSPPAPPASGCSGSGTVAAGTTAATGTIAQQLHHQRTLKTQRDHSSIRNSGNNSSTSGRSGRQQTNIAVVGGNIHLVAHDDGCHQFLSVPSTANHDDDDDDDELSSLTTPLFLPEVDWTNETCIGGGLDFSSSIVKQQLDDQHQHLWISSPASSSSNITDSELERRLEEYDYRATREDGQQQHLLSISQLGLPQLDGNNSSSVSVGGATSSTMEQTVDCNNLLLTGGKAKEVGEPQPATIFITGSPVSLHEEIEQLSSGFDCDATNHLVSTGPSAAQLSFIVDDEPDHFQQQQHGSGADSLSLNIFKWLQEDISSSILVDKQQTSSSAAANTNLLEAVDVPSSVSYLLANDSTEISFSPSPASNHLLQQPVLEEPFENSLDQIQTLHRTTPVSGAGGGHKTAIKSEPSFVLVKGNNSHTTTTAETTTTTTTTNTSAVNPQYDHNYSTIKRRNQDSGDQAHNHLKPKMLKLSNDHQQEGQQTTSRHTAAKDSTTVKVTARSTEDSYWRTVQPGIAATQTTVNTNAASSTATTTKNKLSVAHRKAPTLKVHLGGGAQPPTILSMQDPFLLLNKTLHPTTTTTTTTGTTNIFGHLHHRMPPQATLNTPDLTNDILDLEDEKFDLLSFIDTNDDSLDLNKYNSVVDEKPTLDDVLPSASRKEEEEETEQKADTANSGANSSTSTGSRSSSNSVKDSTEIKIPQPLTLDSLRQLTASTEESQASTSSPSGRYRAQHHHLSQYGGSNSNCSIGSRSSASSVCGDSDVSSNTTTTQTPKRRGRPPKAVGTVRDRSQYEHLSEADWRYREQRDKNNEASRKSRINRKDRELKLESEADRLNMQHQKLSYEERRLQRDCQKWRKAVMKLALL